MSAHTHPNTRTHNHNIKIWQTYVFFLLEEIWIEELFIDLLHYIYIHRVFRLIQFLLCDLNGTIVILLKCLIIFSYITIIIIFVGRFRSVTTSEWGMCVEKTVYVCVCVRTCVHAWQWDSSERSDKWCLVATKTAHSPANRVNRKEVWRVHA